MSGARRLSSRNRLSCETRGSSSLTIEQWLPTEWGPWLWAPCARPHGHCLHSPLSFKLPKDEDYLTFFKNVVSSSQVVLVLKNPPANAGDVRDPDLVPGLGRSSGGGHGNPLQYSGLENPMNRIP